MILKIEIRRLVIKSNHSIPIEWIALLVCGGGVLKISLKIFLDFLHDK